MISAISGRTALVVDDDPLLVRLSCRALRTFGFDAIDSADSGESALSLIRAGTTHYDVLLCDLAMPSMDGVEVLHHLAELDYQGAIIIVSGQDDRVIQSVAGIANANRLNILGWLHKPFAIEALRELLGRVDSPTGSPALSCPSGASEADFSLTDLTRAIYNREIDAHFQPKLDLATGEVGSVEALARWHLPDGTAISPDRFVRVAEQYELGRPLTDLILEKALSYCRHWSDQGFSVNVAVNIPAFTLADASLPRSVQQAAGKAGVDPHMLTLEITETQLLREPLTSLETLNRLRLLGVRLSIDDFGTGYSSLKQLQLIPFQELKIDRDFVQRALDDSVSRAIVESSIQLARSAGLTVVAEGVETPDQLNLMQQLNCDSVQGYLIARPMPGDAILRWLSSRQANRQQTQTAFLWPPTSPVQSPHLT